MNCKYMNMLRVVRGNAFKLKIAVEAYTPSGRRIDSFALGKAVLKLDKNGTLTTKEYTILEGTTILVAFDGSESLGVYGFQMSGEYEGEAWRWANAEIFQIVESNVKAHIPEGCVLLDDTYNMALKIVLSGGDGVTFTPSVSEQGIISWTNDGGLPNPEPRNIRGPRGEQGPQGEVGPRGPRGPMGLRGQIGPKGDKGDKGDTGSTPVIDATASVDDNIGTPQVFVDVFGPHESRTFDFSFRNLKGERGETGATGAQGPQGAKGDTGATGPQGPQGPQGIQGLQGEQGPQGEPGNYTKPASGIPLSDLNGNVASGIVYDVTANNSGATFASLSALLSSGSLSTLIPTDVRKGGMQIRFVQSSDNKYVQYRCIADEFTTDTTQWAICDDGVYIENPEYIRVYTDKDGKILWGIQKDGNVYFGYGVPSQIIEYVSSHVAEIQAELATKVDKVDGKGLSTCDYTPTEKEIVNTVSSIENPVYIKAETDSEGKTLAGRRIDGSWEEKIGFTTPSININNTSVKNIDDVKERISIITDSNDKEISYREKDGRLVENAGFKTTDIEAEKLTVDEIIATNVTVTDKIDKIKVYDLPEKGTVNITSETFYLTANSGYSDLNGVYPIQVYANTVANARLLRVCQKYYVKSSLVDNGDGTYSLHNDGVTGHDIGLDFYAAGEVKKISGVYYVKSSLEDGQVVPTSIVVTQLTGVPNLQAWTVDKEIKHYCTAVIDFGKYLSGTFSVEVKFQGSSTLYWPKRNLRFTFYKNSSFAKKLKLKIGEMVRTSGYNLKAFYNDPTRIKEYILNRLFMAIWEKRPNADAVYPWNKNNSYYTDATGMIKSFPIKLSLGGVFYGFMIFGLKKDEKNYMLDGDDDASGIFVSGEAGNDKYNAKGWADELGVDGRELAYPELGDDSVSVETATAINNFFKYLVGEYKGTDDVVYGPSDVQRVDGVYYVRDTLTYDSSTGTYSVNGNSISTEHIEHFNKSDAYEHINILDWIDYLICIEVFYMSDNTIHNMTLYTDKDKEKFSSFLYDVDSSFNFANPEGDVLSYWTPTNNIENDALWGVIFNNYKDDIHRRYEELRGSVLNVEYLASLLEFVYGIIPAEWFTAEQNAWGSGNRKIDYTTLTLLEKRLKWMDKSFFNIRN